jgi:UDP-glucose 4-epimerase
LAEGPNRPFADSGTLLPVTTYLVTGAAGFIGSHLCDRLLAEGGKVVAVDDLSTGRIANISDARGYGTQFSFHDLDVRSEGLAQIVKRHEPEVVLHLAAQSGVRPSLKDPIHDAGVNVLGTLNVLEAAVAAGARKVVYAASGGTLYGEPDIIPVRERQRWSRRPVQPYGISKGVVLDYLEFYRTARGLDYTALALANVYGPRQDPHGEGGVIAVFARMMLAGEQPAIHGDGSQTRDYVFVDDTVHAFSLATGEKASGALLNVGTSIETTVTGIYRMLADATGYRGEPRFDPAADAGAQRSALDATEAEAKLDWRPWTTLEDGLAETVAYIATGDRETA